MAETDLGDRYREIKFCTSCYVRTKGPQNYSQFPKDGNATTTLYLTLIYEI